MKCAVIFTAVVVVAVVALLVHGGREVDTTPKTVGSPDASNTPKAQSNTYNKASGSSERTMRTTGYCAPSMEDVAPLLKAHADSDTLASEEAKSRSRTSRA